MTKISVADQEVKYNKIKTQARKPGSIDQEKNF